MLSQPNITFFVFCYCSGVKFSYIILENAVEVSELAYKIVYD